MKPGVLNRVFKLGLVPAAVRPVLESEGIELIDEGLSGSVTLKHFRAPGRRHSWKQSWVIGCMVLTKSRFAAWQFSEPIIDIPLEPRWLGELEVAVEADEKLHIRFDSAKFDPSSSGSVEVTFKTRLAEEFAQRLRAEALRDA